MTVAELPHTVVVIIIILAAFLSVMGLSLIRWPTIPAYFITGVFLGPFALGILDDSETAQAIAEFGVILLLFTIGLKFRLGDLHAIRRHVIWLGGAQTFLTALLFGVPVWYFTDNFILSLLVGSIAAMSSTAVVSQILIDENIITSPVGNRAMGVLLFQDLAVIPLIIVFSTGGAAEASSVINIIVLVLVKVTLIMAVVLYVGGPAMSAWFNMVARYGGKELYMLNLVMVISLLSGLTAWAGLSHALGAFIAGILISETLHRYRVMQVVEPLRHIFLGFFFVSLGVLVNPDYIFEHWVEVLGASVLLVIVKGVLVYTCAKSLGTHTKTSLFVSLLLCGAGEFGFVLLTLAHGQSLVEEEVFQLLLSANLVALVGTSFLWTGREKFARLLQSGEWMLETRAMTNNLAQSIDMTNHVVIAGFGRTGQAIAGILRELKVPYIGLEEDYQILQSIGGTDNVLYGESTGASSLISAGCMRAQAIVVSFTDPIDSRLVVEKARQLNKNIHIIARADTVQLADKLIAAGADNVYVDAHELGFSIARELCVKQNSVTKQELSKVISRSRRRENPYFTGSFGEDAESLPAETDKKTFIGCVAHQEFPMLASVIADCEVISWLRDGANIDKTDTNRSLRVGDELVLSGNQGTLQKVKEAIESASSQTP